MTYTTEDKEQIKQLVLQKCERLELSKSDAAIAMGISDSSVSLVFNNKYKADDTAIFRLLARWVGFGQNELTIAETLNYKLMVRTLTEAQQYSEMFAIVGEAGHGKSTAQKAYADSHKFAFYILCKEYYSLTDLLNEILNQMGVPSNNESLSTKLWEISYRLRALDKPLLMFDEASVLRPPVMQVFKELYNDLEGHCGITITATNHLIQKLKRGLQLNKLGFKEIWSRIGRKPIELVETRKKDIVMICNANGIEDVMIISQIVSDSEGDLRRVKRMIDKHNRKEKSTEPIAE